MKKLLFTLFIALSALVSKAQVNDFHFVNSADMSGAEFTFYVWGDNTL